MAKQQLTQAKIERMLDWAYKQALSGHGPIDGAIELAEDYQGQHGSPRKDAESLIRWQNTKAATSGFLSGLPGILAMPVTLPANLTSVLFIQLRMIAAIAHLGGYDLNNDRVKTLCFVCLCGNAATPILKDVGIQVGKRMAISALKRLPGKVFIEINKAVGVRLLTKFGTTGIINVGRIIPLISAPIVAMFDLLWTNAIGKKARDIFLP